MDKYWDAGTGRWRDLPVTSASTNRYPMGDMAVALDAVVRYGKPVEPIPQVQQSGAGPHSAAIFRKPQDEEVVLYVRGRAPLRPTVLDSSSKAVGGVLYEPLKVGVPPEAPPGFWRLRATEATTVTIQGLVPVFAADLPERHFLPDVSAIRLPAHEQ